MLILNEMELQEKLVFERLQKRKKISNKKEQICSTDNTENSIIEDLESKNN